MRALTRVLRSNIRVVPVQPVASELYYEYRDTNGTPSEYTLVIGYINGLHYTATKRISGTLSCAGDGHRKFDSVAFDWDQAAVQDEFAAEARTKPTLQLLHDLKWYAYATSADGDCMPDSLAACSRRTEFLFRRHGRTWPQDFPMTAAAWRTCLGEYIQDNAAAFTINTEWTPPSWKADSGQLNLDAALRGTNGLMQPRTWLHNWLLHIAATKFATLKITGCEFDDGSPAHVRLFQVFPSQSKDSDKIHQRVLQWVLPCTVHEWQGKQEWTTKAIEKVDESVFREAKRELDRYMNIGRPYIDAEFEPLLHDAVIINEPANHFMYCAPAHLNDRLDRISNLMPRPQLPRALAQTWEEREERADMPSKPPACLTSGAVPGRGGAACHSQTVPAKRQRETHKAQLARKRRIQLLLSHPGYQWGAAFAMSQNGVLEMFGPRSLREHLAHSLVAAVTQAQQVSHSHVMGGALPQPAEAFVGDAPNGENRLEKPHLVCILRKLLLWNKNKPLTLPAPHDNDLAPDMVRMLDDPQGWSAPAMCTFPQGKQSFLNHQHYSFAQWKKQVGDLLTMDAWTFTGSGESGIRSDDEDGKSSNSDDISSPQGSKRLDLHTVLNTTVTKNTNYATCVAMIGLWLNYHHPGVNPCPLCLAWFAVPELA